MVAGIYLITNKINGHMYVGGSKDIKKRIQSHKNCYDIETSAIDKAINKYGKENFSYQIITELTPNWDVIGQHEKYWINFYNTYKNKDHYNLTPGGDEFPVIKGKDHYRFLELNIERIIELYRCYTPIKEISKKMGCSPNTISRRLKDNISEEEYNRIKKIIKSKNTSGENNPMFNKDKEKCPIYKNYPRIVKVGKYKDKQIYGIKYGTKMFARSSYKERLYEKWYAKHPDIELIDETI